MSWYPTIRLDQNRRSCRMTCLTPWHGVSYQSTGYFLLILHTSSHGLRRQMLKTEFSHALRPPSPFSAPRTLSFSPSRMCGSHARQRDAFQEPCGEGSRDLYLLIRFSTPRGALGWLSICLASRIDCVYWSNSSTICLSPYFDDLSFTWKTP